MQQLQQLGSAGRSGMRQACNKGRNTSRNNGDGSNHGGGEQWGGERITASNSKGAGRDVVERAARVVSEQGLEVGRQASKQAGQGKTRQGSQVG